MTLATTQGSPSPRVAFYGRAAGDRDGSAASTIIRQYEQCLRALPPVSVTAVFYDIGANAGGRRRPVPDRLPLPGGVRRRDGGLADLVAEALSPHCRFDYIVASGPDRLSRDTRRLCVLLRHLHAAGVPCLFPASTNGGGDADMTWLLMIADAELWLRAWQRLLREGDADDGRDPA